ncbi:hypothetical protein [Sphingomonas sp. LT1P40]|uniref:hypothetical protein n=1 Tax=Alteristakelama amylovorans TaxID=3096166 RepID=UPI002FC8239C
MRMLLKGMAAVALVAGIATTAQAETKPGTPAPSATASSETKVVKDKRYCLEGKVLGSNINRTECKTRAQWMREGFDPLDAK